MTDNIREYDAQKQPVAIDDRDPGNTDPDELTASLDPADDVYSIVNQDQGDLRESAPVGEDQPNTP